MSKSKRTPKSKKAAKVTRFTCDVEVQESHFLDIDIQPIGHHRQPPHELADSIASAHAEECVEYSSSKSGEIEWEGKRYTFTLKTELYESGVTLGEWNSMEQVKIGSDR